LKKSIIFTVSTILAIAILGVTAYGWYCNEASDIWTINDGTGTRVRSYSQSQAWNMSASEVARLGTTTRLYHRVYYGTVLVGSNSSTAYKTLNTPNCYVTSSYISDRSYFVTGSGYVKHTNGTTKTDSSRSNL